MTSLDTTKGPIIYQYLYDTCITLELYITLKVLFTSGYVPCLVDCNPTSIQNSNYRDIQEFLSVLVNNGYLGIRWAKPGAQEKLGSLGEHAKMICMPACNIFHGAICCSKLLRVSNLLQQNTNNQRRKKNSILHSSDCPCCFFKYHNCIVHSVTHSRKTLPVQYIPVCTSSPAARDDHHHCHHDVKAKNCTAVTTSMMYLILKVKQPTTTTR
jgi:hypothetical protein